MGDKELWDDVIGGGSGAAECDSMRPGTRTKELGPAASLLAGLLFGHLPVHVPLYPTQASISRGWDSGAARRNSCREPVGHKTLLFFQVLLQLSLFSSTHPPLRDIPSPSPHSLDLLLLDNDQLRLSLQPITVKTSSFLSFSVSFASLPSSLRPRAASSAFLHTPPVLRCTVLYTPKRRYAKKRGKMPPKKQVEEKKILLGRPGNSLKSGIVGHPSQLCPGADFCCRDLVG